MQILNKFKTGLKLAHDTKNLTETLFPERPRLSAALLSVAKL